MEVQLRKSLPTEPLPNLLGKGAEEATRRRQEAVERVMEARPVVLLRSANLSVDDIRERWNTPEEAAEAVRGLLISLASTARDARQWLPQAAVTPILRERHQVYLRERLLVAFPPLPPPKKPIEAPPAPAPEVQEPEPALIWEDASES